MQQPNDTQTLPLDLPKRGGGRPATYANNAERQAAYRARKGAANLSVQLDPHVADLLDQYMQRQAMDGAGLTKSQVIEKFIRQQLLRKR